MLPLVALVAIGTFAIYCFVLYPFFLSPLAKIPNAHWSAPISSFWVLRLRYRYREKQVLHEAHQRLGPVVRVGPQDLSVSSYDDGVRVIYGGGFDKPGYFDFYKYFGEPNAFCSLLKRDHALYRRRVSSVYSKSALYNSEHLMDITEKLLGGTFMSMIQGYADSSSPVDMLTMTYALCLDWVDSFIFGYSSINKLLRPDGNDVDIFLKYYEERYSKEAFWLQELPALSKLVTKLGFSIIPKEGQEATRWLEDWLQQMCDRADTAIEKGDLLDAANIPIVYQQVKQAVNRDCLDDSETTRKRKIASELFDHMSSAREVLGLVLGYAIFYISGKPEVQSRLREELLSLSSPITAGTSESQLPTPSSLECLPYLDAVIKESLRMRPTSTPLPRITPTDKAVTLGGFENIPPGTRVNTFQWFVHRDPRAWSNVDEWIPERWLAGNDGADSGVLWPFVTGSRMCLGSHLAGYIMRYTLAAIYTNFTTSVDYRYTSSHEEPGSLEDQLMIRFHLST